MPSTGTYNINLIINISFIGNTSNSVPFVIDFDDGTIGSYYPAYDGICFYLKTSLEFLIYFFIKKG